MRTLKGNPLRRKLRYVIIALGLLSVLGWSVYLWSQYMGAEEKAPATASLAPSGSRELTGKGKSSTQTHTGIFSAYTSSPDETDESPHITADGTNTKTNGSCIVANNQLELGTRIDVEGIGICEVRDRMGQGKDPDRFDIHMGKDRRRAKEFGERKLEYRIIDLPDKKAG